MLTKLFIHLLIFGHAHSDERKAARTQEASYGYHQEGVARMKRIVCLDWLESLQSFPFSICTCTKHASRLTETFAVQFHCVNLRTDKGLMAHTVSLVSLRAFSVLSNALRRAVSSSPSSWCPSPTKTTSWQCRHSGSLFEATSFAREKSNRVLQRPL